MACFVCVSSALGNPTPGGTYSGTVNGNLINPGSVPYWTAPTPACPGGTFTADGILPATYILNYSVGNGNCQATSTLTINVIPGVNPLATVTVSKCVDDTTPYELWALSGAAAANLPSNGSWSATGTPTPPTTPGGWNQFTGSPTDDIVTPSLLGVGMYQFVYTYAAVVPPGFPPVDPNCTNCQQTFTFNLNVLDVPLAGTNSNITLCN